jgi:drug/metabolite transporter (DMT)-like permease
MRRSRHVSLTAVVLILVAAVAHASWNLFSKQASAAGAAVFVWLLGAAAAVLYAPVVAISVVLSSPRLGAMNWLFLIGTGLLQCGYFLFLQFGYRLGDLSLVYPIGRGTGALLAALAGILILGERPGPLAIAGICCIVAGIVTIGLPARPVPAPAFAGAGTGALAHGSAARILTSPAPSGPQTASAAGRGFVPVAFALCTGTFIAAYTLWDKYAVSTLHTPPLLQGYASFPMMLAVFAPRALRSRQKLSEVWRRYWRQITGAAVLAPLAYVLVLIALSFSPLDAVAPAREVSVLFGVLLGRRLLGEEGLPRKLAAAAVIVAGIVAVAIG